MRKPKPKPKPYHQWVEWTPGAVVRGIVITTDPPTPDRGFVATLDGTIQEFEMPESLARQLDDVPSGALLIITCTGPDVFRVQSKPYGVWLDVTRKQLTLKLPEDPSR